MKNYIFLILMFISFMSQAQVDSLYIKSYKTNASARVYTGSKYSSLTYEYNKGDDKIEYKPNMPILVGVGMAYKNSAINIGYRFPFLRNRRKGKTQAFDLQYHHYGRKYVFDVFVQNYKGFYKKLPKEKYEIYPDIKLSYVGITGQHIFNYKKFSYKAAFNQNETQVKSAGSFQAGGGLFYTQIKSDSSLTLKNRDKENTYQAGINAGYIHTFVIKRFFITGGLSMGANVSFDNSRLKGKVRFHPALFPRFSTGYNQESWSVILSFLNNQTYVNFSDDMSTQFNSGQLQLSLIKRFDLHWKKQKN